MNKFKPFGVSILSLGLVLALNPVTTFAAEPETSVVTSESNAIGGWSEEDGYFVNPQAYSKAISPWWSFNGDTSGSARTYYGS